MDQRSQDGLDPLSSAECATRLRAGGVGILALCGLPAPILRPVNFALHERWILMRTGEGRILEAAARGEPASFVLSDVDRLEHTGWSVVVSGRLAAPETSEGLLHAALRPWARADKHQFVTLSLDEVSGRRLATESAAP